MNFSRFIYCILFLVINFFNTDYLLGQVEITGADIIACPNVEQSYTVQTTGSGSVTNCNYTWRVTNGTIVGSPFQTIVKVIWNDRLPVHKGTKSVTIK